MKHLISILALIVLTGCATKPIMPETIKLEELPAELSTSCPDLKKVDQNTEKLSDVITAVADNYSQYHSCRAQVNGLQDWYNKQKTIINKLK